MAPGNGDLVKPVMRRGRFSRRVLAATAWTVAAGLGATASAQAPQTQQTSQSGGTGLPSPAYAVDVIGATPLPGVGLLLEEIPAPVRTAVARDIEASGALDLSDFLNRRLTGVHVNEIQGNPYQADLSYRGYTASPLLGTPQGLSVFMDGVRLNQPFGDVVSWDLIPRIAIASTVMTPGSNPLFGLNTLGGALAVQTKDGRTAAGTSLQATYGSHTRRSIEFENGGSSGRGDWYLAANLFGDDGWRDASPSEVRQFFGKLGWKDGTGELRLGLGHTDNTLTGNGLQEIRLLDRDRAGVYTKPDTTENRSTFVNLNARRSLGPSRIFAANAYYRDIFTNTVNGDVNEESLDESIYQLSAADRAALAAAGYTGFPTGPSSADDTPFPSWPCIAQALRNDEPGEKCDGLLNRTDTKQHNYGASAQMTRFGTAGGGGRRQFTAGAAYDRSTIGFQQTTKAGLPRPRSAASPASTRAPTAVATGDVDASFDTQVNLDGVVQTWSYAPPTPKRWGRPGTSRCRRALQPHDRREHRPASPGRRTRIAHQRRVIRPAEPGDRSHLRALANHDCLCGIQREGPRADVDRARLRRPQPALQAAQRDGGDPPLEQVIARTWEAGVRGGQGRPVMDRRGCFEASIARTSCSWRRRKPGSATSELRRHAVRASSCRSTAAFGASRRVWRTYLDAIYDSAETVTANGNSSNSARGGGSGTRRHDRIRQGRPDSADSAAHAQSFRRRAGRAEITRSRWIS